MSLERVTGFEPVSLAWKAKALPLDDTRGIKKYSSNDYESELTTAFAKFTTSWSVNLLRA